MDSTAWHAMTDGTGVNYPFHEELWAQLEQYFASLATTLFVKYKIPRNVVKVIRIGMDKTGEFNYPYSEVHGGATTNNTWWAFDSGGVPYRDYPNGLVSTKTRLRTLSARLSLPFSCNVKGTVLNYRDANLNVIIMVRARCGWSCAGQLEARTAKLCWWERICSIHPVLLLQASCISELYGVN